MPAPPTHTPRRAPHLGRPRLSRAKPVRADEAALRELSEWLRPEGLTLVAADELRHETYQRDRAQVGLCQGLGAAVNPAAPARALRHSGEPPS